MAQFDPFQMKYESSGDSMSTVSKSLEFEEEKKEQVKQEINQKPKRYIYNKTNQLSRFRASAIKPTFLCTNCGADVHDVDACSICGYPIELSFYQKSKPRNLVRDFDLFIDYYQGISKLPFFTLNYLNHYALEKRVRPTERTVAIKIPIQYTRCYLKQRSDIEQQNNVLEVFPTATIHIKPMSFKEFKTDFIKYREKSKQWKHSSLLPADMIYAQTCYRLLFGINILETISEEDKRDMFDLFQQIRQKSETDKKRKNNFLIRHVIYAMIHQIPQFQKYQCFDIFQNIKLNKELQYIVDAVK